MVVAGDRQNLAVSRTHQIRHHLFSVVVMEAVVEAVVEEAASLLQYLFVLPTLRHPATFL